MLYSPSFCWSNWSLGRVASQKSFFEFRQEAADTCSSCSACEIGVSVPQIFVSFTFSFADISNKMGGFIEKEEGFESKGGVAMFGRNLKENIT